MAREVGKCDRTEAYCHCSACSDHCCHVCAENERQCCENPDLYARCPFCGETAEKCECHRNTHGG